MTETMHQGSGKRLGIVPQVSLDYNTFFTIVQVFNGRFNGDNIAALVLVEIVYHGC